MSSIFILMGAWREILARTLEGYTVQHNVSPEWLVNPATRRRLKLDLYYPDAHLAVRFAGLTAKGQRRQSDWEQLEAEQRDQTRAELCRLNGVHLAVISTAEEPVKQIDRFIRALSSAGKLDEEFRAGKRSKRTRKSLARALSIASDLRSRIAKNPDQMMANLAESWRDREAGIATELQQSSLANQANGSGAKRKARKFKTFEVGTPVTHKRFGEGTIIGVSGVGEEATVSIDFGDEQARTFLISLVADKLRKQK